jgi:hypothetical protein
MDRTTAAANRPNRVLWSAIGVLAFVAGVAIGAYGDWMMWLAYSGFMLAIAFIGVVLVSGMLAVAARGTARRVALVGLVAGVGLIAGQNLGPSREPLITTEGGTMTVRLVSPVAIVATGTATCVNVASETEFAVSGDGFGFPTARLPGLGRAVGSVSFDSGDRWVAVNGSQRSGGVRLDIMVADERIPADGFPVSAVMVATEASTLEATFDNGGGTIRFAGLEAQTRQGLTGEPIDLAGTIEWTCGDVLHGDEEAISGGRDTARH